MIDHLKTSIDQQGYKSVWRSLDQTALRAYWTFEREPQSLAELVYVLVNDLTELPRCQNGNHARFSQFYNEGYRVSCVDQKVCGCLRAHRASTRKIATPEEQSLRQNRYEATMLERYGVVNGFQSEEVKGKIRATNLDRYGVENVSQVADIADKKRATCLINHGHEHSMQSPVVRDRARKTNLERYGHEESFASPEIRQRAKATLTERYGVDNVFKLDEYQDKGRAAIRSRYGLENISQRYLSPYTKSIIHDREAFMAFCAGKNYEMVASDLGDVSAVQIGIIANKFDCVDVFAFGKGSVYQKQCRDWLLDQGFTVLENNRTVIGPKEIDLWLPDHNMGIEIDGLYYHSEVAGRKSQQYHRAKQDMAEVAGVRLIQIFTDEWMFKNDLVKATILRSCGKASPQRIAARTCSIETASWGQVSDFLADNHLQGSGAPTKYNFALISNEVIVAVMTFGRNRKSTNTNGWELVRYCQDSSVNVVGGAERLFKKAINDLDISELTSFSDRRYFSGAIYRKLGFSHKGRSKPGYHYTDYYRRYNRFNFTKGQLVKEGYDAALSEWEIMQARNYDRIWDSGQEKWIWTKADIAHLNVPAV